MYQLLILGNGFDLCCGLKSSYKDFFRSEILDTTVISSELKQLQSGVSGFWESLLLEYYKTYGKMDYNWCDIEKIIKDTLLSIFKPKRFSYDELWGIAFKHKGSKQPLEQIIPGVTGDSIISFLLSYCMNLYSNCTYTYKQSKEAKSFLIAHLLQELRNLERLFCKFLKNQIVNPNNKNEQNEEYIIKAVNLLAKLTGFVCYEFNKLDDFVTVDGKNRLISVFDNLSDIFILNFNYTALFYILEVDYPCAYNNVHGKLCKNPCMKDCNGANVIFGIDDNLIQSQAASSELRLFSKTFRKMLNSDKYIMTLPPNDGNEVRIKFYGHSLSEADYSYFQSIFDYYDLYGNSKVGLTFYYSKGFENHDAVYRLISEYGKTLNNVSQGKNLIHKLLLENRLHIQEVK